ncbi:MAG: protein kinase, partial [Chloroflexota bacterium]
IWEIIAHGGYGAVYKAFQPSVGREVAIKVILPQHAGKPQFKLRFESEAQIVAQLEHPHIMPLYDFWQDDNGAFLVMRLVKGGSLRQQLRQETLISLKNIVRIYDQIGSGLAIAHDAKVVHRDIKPDNILLDQYGNAYLSDFGIAKNLQLDTSITASRDEIMGTPGYLSPEQILSQAITIQTDIYALGIMLYELLTGEAPFNKPGMQVLLSHLNEPVPSVLDSNPNLPRALDQVIARASAKDPLGRYSNVMQMVEALNEIFAPVATPILPREAQLRTIDPKHHVFISYTDADSEFVQRLVYDLKSEGIPVWVDKRGVKAGTRNWENAIREAIQSASAVILIASPDSRRSNFVFDALAIAEMYKCPIYPVWVAGENWADSIATGLEFAPYIDARDGQYADVLHTLVTTLGAGVGKTMLSDEITETIQASGSFTPRNPYKGLRAFRQADQGDFFGRDSLVAELIMAFNAYMQPGLSRLLPVIGPSGSGKSSVVMAGMLPLLQKGSLPQSSEWVYLTPFVPGEQPLENMMLALSEMLPNKSHAAIMADLNDPAARMLHTLSRQIVGQHGSRVVMYIDQFEELFTQSVKEEERQQFINLILTAVAEAGGPLAVVLTLRADFYDRPMHYPELGKVIETNSKLVLPMSLADLFEVVQKPASLPDVRLTFDKGLVAELVFEVRDQAGGLPLLQFTLDQLFERREGSQLTNQAYQAIGGVQGALAKHTEVAYANLPTDDHRRLARGLFMRLIEPGATEQDTTRRRAPRSEFVLADAQQNRLMDQVIDAFVAARLLLADQTKGVTTIEVSHEALIREWPRLREWLDESR